MACLEAVTSASPGEVRTGETDGMSASVHIRRRRGGDFPLPSIFVGPMYFLNGIGRLKSPGPVSDRPLRIQFPWRRV